MMVAVLCAVLVLAVPWLPVLIPIPELEFDLAESLGEKASLVDSTKITARLDVERGEPDGYRVRSEGKLLGWPYHAAGIVRFGLINMKADFCISLDGTDWKIDAHFDAKSGKDWSFKASIPPTKFGRADAIVADILAHMDMGSVTDLDAGGMFSLDADGACVPERPVAAWNVKGFLKDADVSCLMGDKTVAVDNLRVRFGAKGVGGMKEMSPLFPRADSVSISDFALTNVFASARSTERSWLVTEAGAGCCGGDLRVYALFLDPERLTAGATVFVDGVDAGEVLSHIRGFEGEATGRMYGKVPFFLKDRRMLRLGNAYLFSKPGDTGTLKLRKAGPILDSLESGGVAREEIDNLEKALANLEYRVLKLDLRRGEDEAELEFLLDGTATRKKTTVPVNLDVTYRGDLDEILDLGMKFSK